MRSKIAASTDHVDAVDAWSALPYCLKTVYPILHTAGIPLWVNHPANSITADEKTLQANVDADMDEGSFAAYGHLPTTDSKFIERVQWMQYARNTSGVRIFINDNWGVNGNNALNNAQLDFSVASYEMGAGGFTDPTANSWLNEYGNVAALFASPSNGYGLEQWHSQYSTSLGFACEEMQGSGPVFTRKFEYAYVVALGGSTTNYTVMLPSNHTYSDLFGRSIGNGSVTLQAPDDGYVLLISSGSAFCGF